MAPTRRRKFTPFVRYFFEGGIPLFSVRFWCTDVVDRANCTPVGLKSAKKRVELRGTITPRLSKTLFCSPKNQEGATERKVELPPSRSSYTILPRPCGLPHTTMGYDRFVRVRRLTASSNISNVSILKDYLISVVENVSSRRVAKVIRRADAMRES